MRLHKFTIVVGFIVLSCLIFNEKATAQKKTSRRARKTVVRQAALSQNYVNSRFGYSFQIPAPLTHDDISTQFEKRSMFIILGDPTPKSPPPEIFIMANDGFLFTSLDDFVANQTKLINGGDFRLLSKENILFGKVPAAKFNYESENALGGQNVWRIVYAYRAASQNYPGATYQITLKTRPETLAQDEKIFDDILSTLKFGFFPPTTDTTEYVAKPNALPKLRVTAATAPARLIRRATKAEDSRKLVEDFSNYLNSVLLEENARLAIRFCTKRPIAPAFYTSVGINSTLRTIAVKVGRKTIDKPVKLTYLRSDKCEGAADDKSVVPTELWHIPPGRALPAHNEAIEVCRLNSSGPGNDPLNKEEFLARLDRVSEAIKNYPKDSLVIVGRFENAESPEMKENLEAAKQFLERKKFPLRQYFIFSAPRRPPLFADEEPLKKFPEIHWFEVDDKCVYNNVLERFGIASTA